MSEALAKEVVKIKEENVYLPNKSVNFIELMFRRAASKHKVVGWHQETGERKLKPTTKTITKGKDGVYNCRIWNTADGKRCGSDDGVLDIHDDSIKHLRKDDTVVINFSKEIHSNSLYLLKERLDEFNIKSEMQLDIKWSIGYDYNQTDNTMWLSNADLKQLIKDCKHFAGHIELSGFDYTDLILGGSDD